MDISLNTIESEGSLIIENFEHLISKEKTAETDAFMLSRINEFSQVTDGTILLKGLKIPYLKMPVISAPWDEMLVEAINMAPRFVPHRSSDSQGWKSLCLHGIAEEKTMSCDRYGFKSEKETPYLWTDVASHCPQTVAWLQKLLDEKYFKQFYRVRYMWLEPGGFIQFHQDREDGQNSLGPLNVALNMPDNCHWLFKKWGKVPFQQGSAICVDVSNQHSVVNMSNEGRIHIIIHGEYGPRYYESLVTGAQIFRAQSALKTAKSLALTVKPTPVPKVEYALWNYMDSVVDTDTRRKCTDLTLHQLKLNSIRITHIIEDHSVHRILRRAYDNGATWCVVTAPGTILMPDIFQATEKMLSSASERAFFFGHLLDRKERGHGFHHQYFAVNVKRWHDLDRPDLGWAEESVQKVARADRSAENVHDDYTPLWLKPTGEILEMMPKVLGWNLLSEGLKAKLECYNLPDSVRSKKSFIYPEQNSVAVKTYMDNILLPREELQLTASQLSDHQQELFSYLHSEIEGYGKKIFVFNTEGYQEVREQEDKRPIDGLYTVSSGFKDLFILNEHGFNSDCTINYMDVCTQALHLKELIYKNWDGRDFPKFFNEVVYQDLPGLDGCVYAVNFEEINQLWERELKAWGGEEKFVEAFNNAKKLRRRFLHVDLVKDPYFVTRDIQESPGKNFVVWYSNCFNYTPGFVSLDWNLREIENQGLSFIAGLREVAFKQNKHVLFYGDDVVWGSRSDRDINLASGVFS